MSPPKMVPGSPRKGAGISKEELAKRKALVDCKTQFYSIMNFGVKLNSVLNKKDRKPATIEIKATLTKGFKIFKIAFKKFESEYMKFSKTKSTKIPVPLLKALKRLTQMKNSLKTKYKKIETKYRLVEERRIKTEYKTTSIEGIKFRDWRESDMAGFSKYVAENAGDSTKLNKLLRNNSYLWNPKGNPELYFQQQCVETAVLLLIQYCYKNHINLALPASDGYVALSNYRTIEDYMGALYPRLSASHLFHGAGGILTEITKKQAKPGDIYTAKHPNGGYHAQMVISNNRGEISFLTGDQMNKDFKEKPAIRKKVERTYPIGFADPQPKATPEEVKMRYGGYGLKPRIKSAAESRTWGLISRRTPGKKDEIKYYRINPTKLNEVIRGITRTS